MKRLSVFFMLFLAVPAIYPQLVEISDYNIEVSKATTLRFDGSWNFAQTGNKVESNNSTGTLMMDQFYSSLPLAWRFTVNAIGTRSMDTSSSNITANGNFKKYIWNDRNWFGKAEIDLAHKTGFSQVSSNLFVGFGVGRYIEATPLAKAVRIEDHLLRDNILSGRLPKETMLKVAGIINRENEYKAIYSDLLYENTWLRDIEDEIQKSDSVKEESVGSLGIMRMRQVLFGINERVNKRFYGWDVAVGFQFETTTSDKSTPGAPKFSFNLNYSIPVGWAAQFTSNFRVSSPMDSAFGRVIVSDYSASGIYELTNRVNILATYFLTVSKHINIDWNIVHTLNISFWYYIENNINLIMTSTYSREKWHPKILTTNVGLQYNLY